MFFLLLLSICYPFVMSIDGVEYDKQDFYSKYSMSEWNRASDKQKKSILEDYIKRESAVLDATSLGFNLDPLVVSRFLDIKNQLLVNLYYDSVIAQPLINSNDLLLARQNLKKELEVQHLLVSHNKSVLQQKNQRAKIEAVELINKIRGLLNGGESFDSLAFLYSDDPGAKKNLGVLGWLEWGRTPMSFQASVWGLKDGSVSAPIETEYGYHLAKVVSSRPSEFFYYDSSSYNYEAIKRSLVLIKEELPVAALSYENKMFSDRVSIYQDDFNVLFSLLSEKTSSLSKGERFVFVDFLKNLDNRLLLFSFDEKYYGVKFFINNISKQNPSKVPVFKSPEDLVSYFKVLILRYVVEVEANKEQMANKVFFKKRFAVERARFLYDFYLKHLVNSVENPDSSSIKQYYLQNRENKYFIPEKVVVRQIKLNSKTLADSLSLIVSVDNFKNIASSFSINRSDLGGLMDPFERGKFNVMGEVAFSLGVGEVSGVIENLDKTFSIIMLEKKIKKEHLPLSRVYKRIESLLLKEGQENIKVETFNKYLNNKKLKLNEEYKIYLN